MFPYLLRSLLFGNADSTDQASEDRLTAAESALASAEQAADDFSGGADEETRLLEDLKLRHEALDHERKVN